MSQVFTYDVATLIEPIESKPCSWDITRGYIFKERVKASFQIPYSQHWMYPVLSFAFFVFSPKIQDHKQAAFPISMHKHLSCAAFNTKLATGNGNASTCENLHDWSRIRFRQKSGVCASGLKVNPVPEHDGCCGVSYVRKPSFPRNFKSVFRQQFKSPYFR
jgi:hypothetical protein